MALPGARPLGRPLAALAVAGGLLLAMLAAHVTPAKDRPAARGTPAAVSTSAATPAPGHTAKLGAPQGDQVGGRGTLTPSWPADLLNALLVVIAAGALLLMLLRTPLARRLQVRDESPDADEPARPEELGRRLVGAVDTGLTDLERYPIREAIVACWQRLLDTAVEVGIEPASSDTPDQVVRRVLHGSTAQAEAVDRLAALYREARFSRHELPESARDEARAALTAIRTDLVLWGARQ